MLSPNKRSRDTTHEGNKKKATSSYGHLKAKFAASEIESGRLQVLVQELRIAGEIESGRLQVLVQELRMKLQETLKTKEELGAIVHGIACSPGNEESSDLAMEQLRDNITILSNANINGGQSICLCNLC